LAQLPVFHRTFNAIFYKNLINFFQEYPHFSMHNSSSIRPVNKNLDANDIIRRIIDGDPIKEDPNPLTPILRSVIDVETEGGLNLRLNKDNDLQRLWIKSSDPKAQITYSYSDGIRHPIVDLIKASPHLKSVRLPHYALEQLEENDRQELLRQGWSKTFEQAPIKDRDRSRVILTKVGDGQEQEWQYASGFSPRKKTSIRNMASSD
jgi:hypothetical protein